LTIEGHGSLLPEVRHKIYAPLAGIVGEVLVDHDARVKKGDVLAKLESYELHKELKSLVADMEKAKQQQVSLGLQAEKSRRGQDEQEHLQIQAQLAEAKITAKSSKERIEILNEQLELMSIRSPQDGVITTWEARKNLLGRPVEIGTELLQVAGEDGDWILEVEVPDDDMGPILAAQSKLDKEIAEGKKKVGTPLRSYFVPMTGPETLYEGYVVRIAPNAEAVAEAAEQYKNRYVVKVTVSFSDAVRKDYLARNQINEMRPGAEVRARVDCGRTNLAYYLLRKPIQVFYESVLFRWPFLR
jgi:pyruvate/2-oxoglutarate dehydrogenase complex dihydrolipoamide acyltransferase (E2) component